VKDEMDRKIPSCSLHRKKKERKSSICILSEDKKEGLNGFLEAKSLSLSEVQVHRFVTHCFQFVAG
jgi:hypothetical protein